MAKKTKERTAKRIVDERIVLLGSLFLFILGLYLLVAFLSHLFTWDADQSLGWQNILHPFSVEAKNVMGPVGATLAALCITKGFGLGAFAIPLLVLLYGIRILRVKIPRWAKRQALLVTGMFLASIVLGYLFGTCGGYLGNGLGGAYGYFISSWGVHFIGRAGTGLLLLFLCVAYLVWLNKKTGTRILSYLSRLQQFIVSKIHPQPTGENGVPSTIKTETPVAEELEVEVSEQPNKPAEEVSELSEHSDEDIEFTIERKENHDHPIIPAPQQPTIAAPAVVNPLPPAQPEPENSTENSTETSPQEGDEIELTIEKNEEPESGAKHISLSEPYDPTLDLSGYVMPPLELLEDHEKGKVDVTEDELIKNKNNIVETLANFGIAVSKTRATVGPTVTLYEIIPAPGVKISKIKGLEDDIALSLAALGIRIIAPIPGRGTIGIEVPNAHPSVVSMLSVLRSKKYQESSYALPLALGRTISNEVYVVDLAKMPHLLVAGATGQGKSVGLNAIIASLLYCKHPSQLKFVLVDPKKVELTLYSRLEKHFLAKLPDGEEPIITDTDKVINTLNSLCIEMDARYDLLKSAMVRNIQEYNEKFIARRLNPEKGHRYLPYIIVVIDEFADLIMTAGRDVELPLTRLAQLARAIGIHLVIATQRPTTNIITGTIKANFPARIAFRVTSAIDSKTILDGPGANQLIGRGDMLINNGNEVVRVQCAFLDTPEVARITDFIGNQPGYSCAHELPEFQREDANAPTDVDMAQLDPYFDDVARMVVEEQRCSTSSIQRKYSIGYNRAGRIVDQLEFAGIVGKQDASKPRQVLIGDLVSLENILSGLLR